MTHISSKITTNYNEYSKINEFLVSWKESKPHVFPHFPFPLGPTVKREKEKKSLFCLFCQSKCKNEKFFPQTIFQNRYFVGFFWKICKCKHFCLYWERTQHDRFCFTLFYVSNFYNTFWVVSKLFLKFDYKFRFYVESKGTHFFKTSFWPLKRFWDIVFVVL